MIKNQVILVDKIDRQIGVEEKIIAHKKGMLHRAFSIYIVNDNYELLLQRRSKLKYHSAGKWSNACCSHPRPGKKMNSEIHNRLKFEIGIDCELKNGFNFLYKTKINNCGLYEHEFDHVFIGFNNEDPIPNQDEVEDWRWITFDNLYKSIKNNPEIFTYWLIKSLPKVYNHLCKPFRIGQNILG